MVSILSLSTTQQGYYFSTQTILAECSTNYVIEFDSTFTFSERVGERHKGAALGGAYAAAVVHLRVRFVGI